MSIPLCILKSESQAFYMTSIIFTKNPSQETLTEEELMQKAGMLMELEDIAR